VSLLRALEALISSLRDSARFECEIELEEIELNFAVLRVQTLRLQREVALELSRAQEEQARYDALGDA
jgi:hypothetical protein